MVPVCMFSGLLQDMTAKHTCWVELWHLIFVVAATKSIHISHQLLNCNV